MTAQIERALNAEIMVRLRASGLPIIALAIPNGIWIPARTEPERSLVARIINRMKADGMLVPGAPDMILMWRDGCAAIELKRPASRTLLRRRAAGKPTEAQRGFAERAAELGIHHAYCTSWEELMGHLKEWGII